jgi:endonuclease/exonuclease/phosphatase family metal-dependent hydrolase
MSERGLDPERGRIVAARLRELGVRGVLLTAAQEGYIKDLACAMPECLCPEELGGRGYFQEMRPDLPDWMPTADHFPVLKEAGGHRTVDNVRLAHRLCNRVDYSKRIGRLYARDLARVQASRAEAVQSLEKESGVWTVLVWNMGLGSPAPRGPRETWNRLSEVMEEYSVDVALLNEVSTALLVGVEGALYEVWGTRGRDRKHRDWCTAIVSPHGCQEIRDARPVSYRGRRPNVRFENSRAGSWIAGVVAIPGVGNVTCVSIYGLLDELSEASVHRSLSEISPLFSDPRYRELLLLGGDLNTSSQWPAGSHLDGDKAILKRIKAYGLIDCLEKMREPGRLPDCRCTLEECTHTWTRLDPSRPALQVDYLFASPRLTENSLESCKTLLSPPDWQDYSDHAPMIATFLKSS